MTDNLPPLPAPTIAIGDGNSTWNKYNGAQMKAYARAAVESALRATVPDGWPTNEMIEAGRKAAESHGRLLGSGQSLWHVFRDMLEASPQAPQAAQPVQPLFESLIAKHQGLREELIEMAAQPVQPKAFYTYIDITLTEEESALLRGTLGEGDHTSPVRLQIGNGHGGYGLYASSAEYPEEGAVRICDVAQPVQPIEQVRKPLSEDEIREAIRKVGMMFTAPDLRIARAIEAAHNIREN
jgi:hypothetical protein